MNQRRPCKVQVHTCRQMYIQLLSGRVLAASETQTHFLLVTRFLEAAALQLGHSRCGVVTAIEDSACPQAVVSADVDIDAVLWEQLTHVRISMKNTFVCMTSEYINVLLINAGVITYSTP